MPPSPQSSPPGGEEEKMGRETGRKKSFEEFGMLIYQAGNIYLLGQDKGFLNNINADKEFVTNPLDGINHAGLLAAGYHL